MRMHSLALYAVALFFKTYSQQWKGTDVRSLLSHDVEAAQRADRGTKTAGECYEAMGVVGGGLFTSLVAGQRARSVARSAV